MRTKETYLRCCINDLRHFTDAEVATRRVRRRQGTCHQTLRVFSLLGDSGLVAEDKIHKLSVNLLLYNLGRDPVLSRCCTVTR